MIPNQWYAILESSEIKKGQIINTQPEMSR
jgi:hypothetical protein